MTRLIAHAWKEGTVLKFILYYFYFCEPQVRKLASFHMHPIWGVDPVVHYDCMFWIFDYAMYDICSGLYMLCYWVDRFQIRVMHVCHKGNLTNSVRVRWVVGRVYVMYMLVDKYLFLRYMHVREKKRLVSPKLESF